MWVKRSGCAATVFILLVVGAAVGPADAVARQGTITGQVTTDTQQPLGGAQVRVVGPNLRTMTDAQGRFMLVNVPAGQHQLEVQHIGYRSGARSVTVAAGATVDVRLEVVRQVLAMDELIVTGTAGGMQRRAIGNVVETVQAADVQAVVHTQTVQELLAGRSAGTIQLGQPGSPGGGYGMRIRGMSSMGLSNAPIVYIDGVRMDAEPRATGGVHYGVPTNRLNTLNPADIASIEIIKGPAAATLYGTEASAGVIQILTHKGTTGAPVYDFTMSAGTSWLWDPAYRVGTSWGISPTTGQVVSANIYEREAREGLGPIFTYGGLQSFQGTVRGGTGNINYFVSGSYSDEHGVVGYDYDKRFSGRVNLELLLSESLTASARVGYVQGDRRHASSGIHNCPICQVDWGSPQNERSRGFNSAPPETWRTVESKGGVDRTTIGLEATFRPVEWLTQRLITGMDLNQEQFSTLWPRQPEGINHYFGPLGLGQKSAARARRSQLTLDYAGTATVPLSDRLRSSTSVGLQYYRSTSEQVGGTASEFPAIPITTLTGGATRLSTETWEENATVGVFVQQQMDWQNRLFVTAAVRGDDNSAFGTEFDAAVYPKASLAWVISEEPFWGISWLPDFRLRGAWGAAGRQPGTFDASRLYTPTVGYNNEPTLQPSAFGNPTLKPERSTELELGFDASFLDDRVNFIYTRFDRRTRDMIVARGIPASMGFPGSQIVNLGQVKGWGNEFNLEADIVERRRVRFSMAAQLATQNNRVLDLGGEDMIPGVGLLQHRVGYSIGDLFMMRVVDATQDANGNLVSALCDGGTGPQGVDFGGPAIPCADAHRVHWGATEPTWLFGVTASTTLWDRLRLHARVEGAGGHVQRGGKFLAAHTSQRTTEAAVLRNDPQDAIFDAYRVVQRDPLTFVEMGFARLREVSATYTVPEPWLGRFGARRGSITVGGRNLLMLWTAQEGWKLRGESSIRTNMPGGARIWDPELRMPADMGAGVEGTQMPPTAGATVTFRLGF
jgi:outer membrane cobalamin receptor